MICLSNTLLYKFALRWNQPCFCKLNGLQVIRRQKPKQTTLKVGDLTLNVNMYISHDAIKANLETRDKIAFGRIQKPSSKFFRHFKLFAACLRPFTIYCRFTEIY